MECVVIAATVPVPLAAALISRKSDAGDGSTHERLTMFAVVLLVGTSIAELVAFATLL